jgi:hypothetical protein
MTMETTVVDADLEHLDGLDADTLLLFLPEEPGPLSGLAGLVDWRLTGGLSRYLMRGWFSGARGEKLLIPTHGRLPAGRVVGIGLGPRGELDLDGIEVAAEVAGKTLKAAKVKSVACGLPGEPDPPGALSDVASRLRAGLSRHFDGRVCLLGEAKALREAVARSA